MYQKIKNVFFLLIFFAFIFIVTKYYFSEQNTIFTNKSRSSHLAILENGNDNLPILKNDTNDVIVYINGLEDFKNQRKERVWEELISNKNE